MRGIQAIWFVVGSNSFYLRRVSDEVPRIFIPKFYFRYFLEVPGHMRGPKPFPVNPAESAQRLCGDSEIWCRRDDVQILPTPGRLVIQQSFRNRLRARIECHSLQQLKVTLTKLRVPDQNLCMKMNAEQGRSKRSIHHC